MNKKIILFNGPARCGKDTLAHAVADYLTEQKEAKGKVVKFAQPLKDAVKAFYGLTDEEWVVFDNERKDEKNERFLGKSSRECQIAMSEVYAKIFHDDPKVFGKVCAQKILNDEEHNLFCVSDSGFVPEGEHIIETFGQENVLLIHIHREGTSYEGDSRNWVDLTHVGVSPKHVDNNDTVESAVLQIFKHMGEKWL